MPAKSNVVEAYSGAISLHAIKSGDQIYYGNKQVFTEVHLDSTDSKSVVETIGHKVKDAFDSVKDSIGKATHLGHHDNAVDTLHKDVKQLKTENAELKKEVADIRKLLEKLSVGAEASPKATAAPLPPPAKATNNDDEDLDLFGSDDEEEDAEAAKIREQRLADYAARKGKKPALIAKSSVLLDVKPWDDETDLKELEKKVRTIELDGLLWGASKLIAIGYGISKLQILCTVEDEKVSVDADLVEKIQDDFADFVQSVDIVAFNKI